MLPIRQLPTGEFTFPDGVKLPIRGLSRAEALQLRDISHDVMMVEAFCISCATGSDVDDVSKWLTTTPQGEIEDLVNAIARLSGLDPEEGSRRRGLALGEIDRLDFILAENLGRSLAEIRGLASLEIEEWRDWLIYKDWETNNP